MFYEKQLALTVVVAILSVIVAIVATVNNKNRIAAISCIFIALSLPSIVDLHIKYSSEPLTIEQIKHVVETENECVTRWLKQTPDNVALTIQSVLLARKTCKRLQEKEANSLLNQQQRHALNASQR